MSGDDWDQRVLAHRYGYDDESLARRPAPAVPPSSAEQGEVRTEGPPEVQEPQTGTQGFLVRHSGVGPAEVWPVTFGRAEPWTPPEYEPPVETRLRTLADAELEAAKDGTRTQKAAAKAAARAYRLAADMIEEEQA